uniref:Uncharacterized protein n=1 Tax=Manihot esculenta TaxID=3983 RepID=A0A2C9V6X6_MANES
METMICVCLSLEFRHGLDLFDIRLLMNGGHGFLIIKLLRGKPTISITIFFLAATTAFTRELSPKIELRTKTNWFHTTMPKNLLSIFIFVLNDLSKCYHFSFRYLQGYDYNFTFLTRKE